MLLLSLFDHPPSPRLPSICAGQPFVPLSVFLLFHLHHPSQCCLGALNVLQTAPISSRQLIPGAPQAGKVVGARTGVTEFRNAFTVIFFKEESNEGVECDMPESNEGLNVIGQKVIIVK